MLVKVRNLILVITTDFTFGMRSTNLQLTWHFYTLQNSIVIYCRNSWSIDPFGQSPTMAYLLKRMGLENLVIQRVHYSVKKHLARSKNL